MNATRLIEDASRLGWDWNIYGHTHYEVYIEWKPWYSDDDPVGEQQFGGDNKKFDAAVRFAYGKAAEVDERLKLLK